jgi:hypothetical protein
MNDDACGQRRSVPTILDQSTIHSWPQNCFTASGMDTPPSDEFHRASCSWFASQYRRPKSAQIALTVRSTVVSETLFSDGDRLGSCSIVQIDDRTGRGGFPGGQESSIRHERESRCDHPADFFAFTRALAASNAASFNSSCSLRTWRGRFTVIGIGLKRPQSSLHTRPCVPHQHGTRRPVFPYSLSFPFSKPWPLT